MPVPSSLDGVIRRHAETFAQQLRAAAERARNEEEIRITAERLLHTLEQEAGIVLEGRHEFTVASGRVDSVYDRVIIEYKNPATPSTRLGPTTASPGTRRVVSQIKARFADLTEELGHPLNALLGVGLDGRRMVFVRYRDGEWDIQEPVELTPFTAQRFLWALFNLGQRGKPFTPRYLAQDFGGSSGLARDGVRRLYETVAASTHPKVSIFLGQWQILFREVCGYDVDRPTDKLKKLAASYGVPARGLKAAPLLFALHTYYALFMKLLAAEVVAFFHKLPTPLQRMLRAASGAQLRQEIEDLEAGSIFRHLHITNFLEGDLFSWYPAAWNDDVERVVRDMVERLDHYNPGTLSEDPHSSRDLLKQLYQELIPLSLRHDLGEYYTPDWLADYSMDELGYDGDPARRVLDPACGSGTFLVLAIARARQWYDARRESLSYDEGELCRKIGSNIVGFDLNPLAVMAARTNYLIAMRDLLTYVDRFEIPVYLCDSILTPAEHADLFTAGLKLSTKAGTFVIPAEIATTPSDVIRYADQLESSIRQRYTAPEFVQRCVEQGLPVTDARPHHDLYTQLLRLDRANQNGIWARIIKNYFAPLFAGRFHFVVGNPPWINWESLPAEYRDSTLSIWDHYRLRERQSRGVRLGNVKKEIAALFVYVCADKYLERDGKLGFIITQAVFKSGANEGFRRFHLGNGKPLRVSKVADLSLLLPFAAINRTAVLVLTRDGPTRYPLPYAFWVPETPRLRVEDSPLPMVLEQVDVRGWLASPVEPLNDRSPWLTAPAESLPVLHKVIGDRRGDIMDRAYAGSCTWLNGAYWIDVLRAGKKSSLIRNLGDVGRKKVPTVEMAVDSEFLFPLLRGRDLAAWNSRPSAFILLPHSLAQFGEPLPLSRMKTKYPQTYEYLRHFEAPLRERSGYKQLFDSRPEFYVVGNVGPYTKKPYKVAFKDLTDIFQCAVLEPAQTPAGPRPIIPDHTVLFLTCDSDAEAHFCAGVLNSIPARVALYCSSVGVQTQRYFPTDISRLKIPTFREHEGLHKQIVRLSRECHELAPGGDTRALDDAERELADVVGGLWGVTKRELASVVETYGEILHFRRAPSAGEEGEGVEDADLDEED